jgi:hypothetical protein
MDIWAVEEGPEHSKGHLSGAIGSHKPVTHTAGSSAMQDLDKTRSQSLNWEDSMVLKTLFFQLKEQRIVEITLLKQAKEGG